MICKLTLLGGHGKACRTVNISEFLWYEILSLSAKNAPQYNSWQIKKHPDFREKPACYAALSTGVTVKKPIFSDYLAKKGQEKITTTTTNKQKKDS